MKILDNRIVLTLLFALTAFCGAIAQNLSDAQVMEIIAREYKAGSTRLQIVTRLMSRGVDVEQIRRLYNLYASQAAAHGVTADDVAQAEERMRRASGGERTKLANQADSNQVVVSPVATTQDVNGRKVFGRDIFNNGELSFEPNMNIATPQNYVLGPGDVVIIDIYGASQKSLTLTVTPDGTVVVPDFGPVAVSGLTVAAAQKRLRAKVGARYSSSELKVTVGQTRTITINVMGEVRIPGTYRLSAFSTVFHALYKAGGINELGTLRNVKVYRSGRLVTVVDIYAYILNGRLAGNVSLQDDDVVIVGPYDCLVDVQGNVKRAMTYEMRSTESVETLIGYAGGFSGDAYRKSVRVEREQGEHRSVYNVGEFELKTFRVADGDVVTIGGSLDRYEDMVEIRGSVFRPGKYRLSEGANSVRALLGLADGVLEDAFLARGVLYRVKEDRTLEVQSVDVAGILAGTVADVPLRNEDMLLIPSQREKLSERTLTIGGEVMSPGVYAYADNVTLEDFVLMAGGLTDAASTAKVDVSRRIKDPKATASGAELAKTFSFSLKDGLVIDGAPGFVLEPYDVVQVRRSPGYQVPRNITVEGEVQFEGNYTLSSKNQRLSDVIKAAGGVTDDAFIPGARLMRRMTADERMRMQSVLQSARMNQDEKDSVDIEKLALQEVYSVGIHLDKALENPGGNYDIVLREGDRLIVPEYNGTVKISGEVQFPNTVAFTAKKGYKWYINQAGGFGNQAKKSKAYIVYQNGTVSEAKKGEVEPGCEIIVPTKAKKNSLTFAQWLGIGSSMASLATMFATLSNLLK